MSTEKKFADGFYFKRRDNAPDFVIGALSIKTEVALQFIKDNTNAAGYVNLDVKKAQGGGFYVELNTYESKSENAPAQEAKPEPKPQTAPAAEEGDGLPF